MNQVQPVSDQHRRNNQKAIRDRTKWRERYAVLTSCIRDTKHRLQAAHRANGFDRSAEIQLDALRVAANVMMLDREWIAEDLRRSSYRYADVESVTS